MTDNRTLARELAMQGLYQLAKMAQGWTDGVWENLSDCDKLVEAAVTKWPIDRLSAVDKSILRLSAYQLGFCPDIPPKVVINEAIELAKKYSSSQAPAFVNGVLDAIFKSLSQKQ